MELNEKTALRKNILCKYISQKTSSKVLNTDNFKINLNTFVKQINKVISLQFATNLCKKIQNEKNQIFEIIFLLNVDVQV